VVGGGQDSAGEVGGAPPGAAGGGEDQAGRVGARLLFGAGLLDAVGDLVCEGVSAGVWWVDGAALVAALMATLP